MSYLNPRTRSRKTGCLLRLSRFALALLIFAALLLATTVVIRPWLAHWGATAAEAEMPLPGDDLIPEAAHQSTLALTVQAPPESIWPWLAQMGAGRGGLYSYSWFERLMMCQMRNANRVIPELQNPQAGDQVRLCAGDFGPPPLHIASLQPGRAFIIGGRDEASAAWNSTWQFVLEPQGESTTRLLLRLGSASYSGFDAILEPVFFIMERRMLQGIQERVEGRLKDEWLGEIEILLWLTAFAGFLVAEAGILFRPLWQRPAAVAAGSVVIILVLAFAQPPLWVDLLGAAAIYAGLAWAFRQQRIRPGWQLKPIS
jgi:hypothetical protein